MSRPDTPPLKYAKRRIIVKLGSSLVTNEGRGVDSAALGSWAAQIRAIQAENFSVILVSSGAISEGMKQLNLTSRPQELPALQAAAAIGQMGLCGAYERCFKQQGLSCAQVLLTHEDMSDRKRYLNARGTILTLLDYRVIPVINENDTVSTDEIKLGDNDTLAALVANLIEADVLIILTDQEGLFTTDPRKDPNAVLLTSAQASSPELDAMVGGAGSLFGTGGMQTKLHAARRAARGGASTIIASGRTPRVLERLLIHGEQVGTRLLASVPLLSARKKWISNQLQVQGILVVDGGAREALQNAGKSLLPVGVTAIVGEFGRGEAVILQAEDGVELGRGLVNYSSTEARKIMQRPSTEIEAILGFVSEPELVHRDNLALSHQPRFKSA